MKYVILFAVQIALAWLWYRIGWKDRELSAIRNNMLAEAEALEKQNKNFQNFQAYMTEDQGIYYIYEKESDMFLVQGKTQEEIVKALDNRFPGAKIWIDKANAREVGYLE